MQRPIIDDATGMVVNVIEIEAGADWSPPDGFTIGAAGGSIGDTWNGSEYVPTVTNEAPPPPVVPVVPAMVTNYQARAALLQAGLFVQVDAMIKALPVTDPAFQAWEYANNVYRNSPLIMSLGAGLDLTVEQIDNLFFLAASIE